MADTVNDDDPLRPLDTLDRYGWRVRWVRDLHEQAVALDAEQLLLLDSSISRRQAEAALIRLLAQSPGHDARLAG